jgi:SOS-response transcriptional repressor LexA
MTPRQRTLLDFIESFVDQRGYSPSYDEMAVGIGVASKSNIHRLVAGLKQAGLVQEDRRGGKRALVPTTDIDLSDVSTPRLVAELATRGVILGAAA